MASPADRARAAAHASARETLLFRGAAFTLLVVILPLHFTGAFSGAPQLAFDVGLENVCPDSGPAATGAFACGYGTQPCHSGRCYGVAGPSSCDGPYVGEAWVPAFRNCAQPVWWPWFLAAVFGVWALVRVPAAAAVAGGAGKPHANAAAPRVAAAVVASAALLFSSLVCVSVGQIKAYWVLSMTALVVVVGAHGFVVVVPTRVDKNRCSSVLRTLLHLFPLAAWASMMSAVFQGPVPFDPAEYNTVIVGAVGVLLVPTLVAFAVAYRLSEGAAPAFVGLVAAHLVTAALVIAFWAARVPLTWFVWPLYLFFAFRAVVRLGLAAAQF